VTQENADAIWWRRVARKSTSLQAAAGVTYLHLPASPTHPLSPRLASHRPGIFPAEIVAHNSLQIVAAVSAT
jgi:hypothetical protein